MYQPTPTLVREKQRWPRSEAEAQEAWAAATRQREAAMAAACRDPVVQARQAVVLLLCLLKCTAIMLCVAIPLVALGIDSAFALLIGGAAVPPPLMLMRDLFWVNLFAMKGDLAFDAEIARRRVAALGEPDEA